MGWYHNECVTCCMQPMRVACSPIMLEKYAWCIRLYCLALGAREIWAFGVEFGLVGPTPAVVSSVLIISYPCPHTIITCTFICGQVTYHVHLPTYLLGTSLMYLPLVGPPPRYSFSPYSSHGRMAYV